MSGQNLEFPIIYTNFNQKSKKKTKTLILFYYFIPHVELMAAEIITET